MNRSFWSARELTHLLVSFLALPAWGQGEDEPLTLAQVEVPLPGGLERYVRDQDRAVAMGKALFWDEQVGSDGRVACATCHHAAGADTRSRGAIHPGPNGALDTLLDGDELWPEHFPILTDDVVGSPGLPARLFEGVVPGSPVERGIKDPTFGWGDERRVTSRNSPSVLNAAVMAQVLWDGRAATVFNGVDGSGRPSCPPILLQTEHGLRAARVAIEGAGLSSQALLPVASEVEMCYAGRTLPDLGKKLLPLRALALQDVHPEDSVLGGLRRTSGRGLEATYADLVHAAFEPALWDSDVLLDGERDVVGSGVRLSPDEYSLAESNFGLFFGLAILLYESTLISDDARYDRVMRGDEHFTDEEALGLALFEGRGCCLPCHAPPEFSSAARRLDGSNAFANTGLRPVDEDPGRHDGRFKAPSLRNVELTAPYFHNGSRLTLRQVVDFYDRGGEYAGSETDTQVQPIGLTERDKDALVRFLLTLTDERVRRRAAPFDGPSLSPPGGECLQATGRAGGDPLRTFLGQSPFAE